MVMAEIIENSETAMLREQNGWLLARPYPNDLRRRTFGVFRRSVALGRCWQLALRPKRGTLAHARLLAVNRGDRG